MNTIVVRVKDVTKSIVVRIQEVWSACARVSRRGRLPALLAGGAWALWAPFAGAAIQFQDVSAQVSLTGSTESWGASVGDFNGDNCPDLYVNGHRDYPRFYRNTCDGSFDDITYEVDPGAWIVKPLNDKHGAAWADVDNDGDNDLLQSVSATGPAIFLVNENGKFVDRAASAGISSDAAARMPTWFDFTRDGFLDLAQAHTQNSYLRRRNSTQGLTFSDDAKGAGFSCTGRNDYAQMLDLNNDGILEFLCAQVGNFPVKVYNVATRPFIDVTSSIPKTTLVNDSVIADFNNDLLSDMVEVHGFQRPSGAVQVNAKHIESWLRANVDAAPDKGFRFSAPGEITVAVSHKSLGIRGTAEVVVLNSNTTNTSAVIGPIGINYQSGRWEITIKTQKDVQAYVRVDTAANITGFTVVGLENAEGPKAMRHLVNSAGGLNVVTNTGLNSPVRCVSAVAGDFNNDMWVDLYLVCRDGPSNIANLVYENQGNGTFALVSNHGGEGPIGTDAAKYGVGENSVVFDYDGDGRLDVAVLNGLLFFPVRVGGPDTLLRNTTSNANRWLELDLRGTRSNRDGVGAKVFVTAGGLTQLREQNGGYHRYSQNHQRLHFGLGTNQSANISVRWPSGALDTFQNVQGNRLYQISESPANNVPGSLTVKTFGPPVHTRLNPGDECGEPPYNFDYGPVLLLWRDCSGSTWHLRAKGGWGAPGVRRADGTIVADTPFGTVSGYRTISSDSVSKTGSQVTFSIGVLSRNDKGVDFDTGGQSSACFKLTRQELKALIVGSSRKRVTAPFDLFSFNTC